MLVNMDRETPAPTAARIPPVISFLISVLSFLVTVGLLFAALEFASFLDRIIWHE